MTCPPPLVCARGRQGGAGPNAIAVADLDGDGDVDLAVSGWTSGTVTVLLRECSR